MNEVDFFVEALEAHADYSRLQLVAGDERLYIATYGSILHHPIICRSGLVVKFVLAMHEPRVRFTAATFVLSFAHNTPAVNRKDSRFVEIVALVSILDCPSAAVVTSHLACVISFQPRGFVHVTQTRQTEERRGTDCSKH